LHGAFWFLLKVGLYLYLFMWLRFTFPRYRFDQLMRLGWQFLIPLSIVNVMGIGLALVLHRQYGWSHWTAFPLTTILTLVVAGMLASAGAKKDKEHAVVGEEA
jgi:NADH-quinone oxidoreductase subunit H